MIKNAKDLQKIFNKVSFLNQALTHRSWVNENSKTRGTNERLEFLGDAVLEFVVSDKLYKTFPKKEEGYLTALRANLVNTKNLSEFAREIKLGDLIYLSKGEEEGGGRDNTSLLADCVEAVIGALFMDQGIKVVYDFIETNLLNDLETRSKLPLKDPKSRLQEEVQAKKIPAPKYQVISEEGPDHNKKFVVGVLINGEKQAEGIGKNKSEAEQSAATLALEKWAQIE